jgi:hypothetical protein
MIFTKYGLVGLGLLLTLGGLDARSREPDLEIDVHIYNYSAVSKETMIRARYEVERIFQFTGVKMVWLECPVTRQDAATNRTCTLPSAHPKLELHVLTNSMADALETGNDTFGSALLPANGSCGVVAYLYADRVRGLAQRGEFDVILGRVIAHELGHLLLGNNSHSTAGIMKARWTIRDLERTREASMSFLPVEAKEIHAGVLARIGRDKSLSSPKPIDLSKQGVRRGSGRFVHLQTIGQSSTGRFFSFMSE